MSIQVLFTRVGSPAAAPTMSVSSRTTSIAFRVQHVDGVRTWTACYRRMCLRRVNINHWHDGVPFGCVYAGSSRSSSGRRSISILLIIAASLFSCLAENRRGYRARFSRSWRHAAVHAPARLRCGAGIRATSSAALNEVKASRSRSVGATRPG